MGRKKKQSEPSANKRGPKGWAGDLQDEYLTSLIAAHAAARSRKTLGDFWTSLWEGWFNQWPVEVTDEEKEMGVTAKSKLKTQKNVSFTSLNLLFTTLANLHSASEKLVP